MWYHIYQVGAVVVSLIILEGLLSFDNALVLAAMVQPLPEPKQKLALRVGLLGAYVMRGLSIFFVAYLIATPWIKPIGAAWLLYLMCSNLGGEGDDDDAQAVKVRSFFWTVVAVEMADMLFSIDNIFAAAAFSNDIWAVLAGVALGILAMRFVAGIFVDLIKRFPVLAQVGYVLVGYIGVTLALEYFLKTELSESVKFAGVVGIMALGIAYERIPLLNRVCTPLFKASALAMHWIAVPIDFTIEQVKSVIGSLALWAQLLALAEVAVVGACAWVYFAHAPLPVLGYLVDGMLSVEIAAGALVALGTTLIACPRRAA